MDDALNTWLSWNCPECNYRSYQRVETKCTIPTVESKYVLGREVICLNCKLVSDHPDKLKVDFNGKELVCEVIEDATNKKNFMGSEYPLAKVVFNKQEYFVMRLLGAWRVANTDSITYRDKIMRAMFNERQTQERQNR